MKVIHDKDDKKRLTEEDRERIAILKLMDNGQYVEGVGIKDNDYFLLVEDRIDEKYLARYFEGITTRSLTISKEDLIEAVQIMMLEDYIKMQREQINARLKKKRKVG